MQQPQLFQGVSIQQAVQNFRGLSDKGMRNAVSNGRHRAPAAEIYLFSHTGSDRLKSGEVGIGQKHFCFLRRLRLDTSL